jgi:hypothetical protein
MTSLAIYARNALAVAIPAVSLYDQALAENKKG